MKEQTQVSIGIIFPSIWTLVFAFLILLSFISTKIPVIISAESLILLTFIFSPFIYLIGLVFSFVRLLKIGLNKDVLFAIVLNVVFFTAWFLIRKSFYIELEFI